MKFSRRIKRAWAALTSTPTGKRIYDSAKFSRLNADWFASNTSADTEVYQGMVTSRNRARDLERNNPYIRKYLNMVETNVVGSGFRLTNRARNDDGKMDERANRFIEESFAIWSRKKFASASGRLSFQDMQRLWARSLARDGEVICRIIRGFDNPWGFSLQFIDTALLDEDLNTTNSNGNKIIMGIELDKNERPVNYYFKDKSASTLPNEINPFTIQNWTVIPADEILHGIDFERANQTRAVTPMSAIMENIKQLQGYMTAELVAARIAACKMGFYTSQSGDDDTYNENEDQDSLQGEWLQNAEPGLFENLPTDHGFIAFDPQHPTTAFDPFVKAELRAIASGVDVSYNMLANDSEGVNFSSLRGFVVAERDGWIIKQNNEIEDFIKPVFSEWLRTSMMTGIINLPFSKFFKFDKPHFQGKRWQWVDPKKDAEANEIMTKHAWKTDSQVTSEQGGDFAENIDIQSLDNTIAEGVTLPPIERSAPAPRTQMDEDDMDDDNQNNNIGLKKVS